jgi:hypothetical protein
MYSKIQKTVVKSKFVMINNMNIQAEVRHIIIRYLFFLIAGSERF